MYRTVAAALLFAACLIGNAAPVFAQAPAQAPITIAIRDHQFVPAEVPVPAGVKVELTIRNEQAVPAEFESHALKREKIIAPGAAVTVSIGPLKPGRYEFFDEFHPKTRGFVVVQ